MKPWCSNFAFRMAKICLLPPMQEMAMADVAEEEMPKSAIDADGENKISQVSSKPVKVR